MVLVERCSCLQLPSCCHTFRVPETHAHTCTHTCTHMLSHAPASLPCAFREQTGSHWEVRYLVFNLQDSAILVYEDEKELRSRIKTRIPMSEIMNADIPKSKQMQATHEFIVRSTKREYHFRTASREHRDAWVCVINTVSPTGSPKTQRRALSRTRAPSQTPSRRPGSGAGLRNSARRHSFVSRSSKA